MSDQPLHRAVFRSHIAATNLDTALLRFFEQERLDLNEMQTELARRHTALVQELIRVDMEVLRIRKELGDEHP